MNPLVPFIFSGHTIVRDERRKHSIVGLRRSQEPLFRYLGTGPTLELIPLPCGNERIERMSAAFNQKTVDVIFRVQTMQQTGDSIVLIPDAVIFVFANNSFC